MLSPWSAEGLGSARAQIGFRSATDLLIPSFSFRPIMPVYCGSFIRLFIPVSWREVKSERGPTPATGGLEDMGPATSWRQLHAPWQRYIINASLTSRPPPLSEKKCIRESIFVFCGFSFINTSMTISRGRGRPTTSIHLGRLPIYKSSNQPVASTPWPPPDLNQ